MKRIKKFIVIALSICLISACAPKQESENLANSFDKEVDYLIIGAGTAGLSSAIEASDLGIENILILEKTGNIGGAAFYSDGIFGGYDTPITKEQGLNITFEEIYEQQMNEKNYILDEELTKITLEKSNDTIKWLIEGLSIPFQKEVFIKDGYGHLQTIHMVEGNGPGMAEGYNQALSSRENIEVLLETPAIELIYENNKVIGAIAMNKGKQIKIKADAVLLATGGYSANAELMASVHEPNKYFQTSNFKNQNGDGLIMGANIGAATQNLDQIQVYLREYNNPVSQLPYRFNIFIGQDGKRFMDEKRTAQTFNQNIKDDVIDLYGRTGVDYFWSIADSASLAMMGVTEDLSEHNGVFIAETLEELSSLINVDFDTLKETVDTWNSACLEQRDYEFNRTSPMWFPISTGPYYALQTTFFSSVTHGGLVKNKDAQVLRIDGSTIEGLYAAGEVTTVTNANGYTISNSITFGRIAANHVLKYINGEVVVEQNKPQPETDNKTKFDMNQQLNDGEYEASVDGQEGKMTVKTIINEGKIASVEILEQHETENIAKDALNAIPQHIVDSNSVDIDTLSGATMTSDRIINAVINCLEQSIN